MNYYIDLKANKDGKHLIHSDNCIDSCPSHKKIGRSKKLGEHKNGNKAIAVASKEYPDWAFADTLSFCEFEGKKVAQSNDLATRYIWSIISMVVIPIIAVILILPNDNSESNRKEELTPIGQYKKNCFSSWDGRHHNLVKMVKDGLLDSSSFKHIESKYSDDYSSYMRYSATSRLGLTVIKEITVQSDLGCNILEIIKEN